jgi:hypothetical protein
MMPSCFFFCEGRVLPTEWIVIHERDDHYSLQTTEPIPLETLNQRLTKFLEL